MPPAITLVGFAGRPRGEVRGAESFGIVQIPPRLRKVPKANLDPSGENASWPVSVLPRSARAIGWPSAVSQTRSDRSGCRVASLRPSGEKAAMFGGPSRAPGSLTTRSSLPSFIERTTTAVPAGPAVAIATVRPSGATPRPMTCPGPGKSTVQATRPVAASTRRAVAGAPGFGAAEEAMRMMDAPSAEQAARVEVPSKGMEASSLPPSRSQSRATHASSFEFRG